MTREPPRSLPAHRIRHLTMADNEMEVDVPETKDKGKKGEKKRFEIKKVGRKSSSTMRAARSI